MMKKFLLKLSFFIIPIILLAYPLDRFLSQQLLKSNSYHGEIEVWKDIVNKKSECDLAIYGSSRAWVHFDPKILSDSLNCSVYNFGIDGHNFWLQYLRHLEHIKYNSWPKKIILSVDEFTLQKRSDLYNLEQFLPFMLGNDTMQKYLSGYQGYQYFDYKLPLLRYAGMFPTILEAVKLSKSDSLPATRYRGYAAQEKSWNNDFEKAARLQESYSVKVDSLSVLLFEKFLDECIAQGCSLYLVNAPVYIEGQAFVSNRTELLDYYQRISINKGIPYYDFSTDTICKSKDYFYNATHLNKKGSILFSQKLSNLLNN